MARDLDGAKSPTEPHSLNDVMAALDWQTGSNFKHSPDLSPDIASR